jgi:HEAT repeat protein
VNLAVLFARLEGHLRGDPAARLVDLAALVEPMSGPALVALSQSLRNRPMSVGLEWIRLDRQRADRLLSWSTGAALAALLSMHRDGYVREAAIGALALDEGALSTRALLLRFDDVVEGNRRLAAEAIARRMTPGNARAFASMAFVLNALARRARAGGALSGLVAYLTSPLARDALIEATASPDPPVRLSSLRWLLPVVGEDLRRDLLSRALGDPTPEIARWAAVELTSSRCPPAVQRALLPWLEGHRSAELRRRAAQARGRLGDAAALRLAMLDRSSAVRHAAREKYAALRGAIDTRSLCIEALAGDPPRARLLGAIAALGDAGLRGDLPLLSAFLRSGDAGIRAEAVRAAGRLGGDAEVTAALADPSARVRREAQRVRGEGA